MTNVNVIDLDDFVVGWDNQLAKSKGLNSSQNVTHTIDWSRVNIATEQPSYSSAVASAPHSVTLFKSRFENKSSGEQEHTFSAESKYTSSSSVSLRQCITLNDRTKVDLSLPVDVLDATSAFGQKVSVTRASTQTSEKEHTWNVNTKIAVPAGETITAQQTVKEVKYSAQFSVVTVISGKVRVTRRFPDGSEVFVEPKNIAEIVRLFQDSLPSFVHTDGHTIRVTNTGTCELTYGVEQYVTVSNCPPHDVPMMPLRPNFAY